LSSPESQKKAKAVASTFFKSTFGALGDLYVVLFLGIFFTVAPQLYKKGIVQLVPKTGRRKANDVLVKLGHNLKQWLKGQLFAMLVVFVLTAIGLAIIGVPMWLALALIAGILNFIPNFGPLIAMVPAVLVSLTQDTTTAWLVAGLYILIQVAESNFITPMVQQKLVNVAPALIIIAQLLMGTLTGGWGIILATPLMVVVMVLVQELYVKKMDKETV
jgi:predicted PurR-regulated permease PerM